MVRSHLCKLAIVAGMTFVGVRSATLVPSSLSLLDVQTTVNSAALGDTVSLPAGGASWSGTLTITNALTLRGMGTNAGGTFLTNSQGLTTAYLINLRPQVDQPARITGISFEGLNAGRFIFLGYTAPSVWSKQLRVDHCHFQYANNRAMEAHAFGVIDHCTFYNCARQLVSIYGSGAYGQYNWDAFYPIPFGSTNFMYVEDCSALWDTNTLATSYYFSDCDQGGSYVYRYCQFNNDSASAIDAWDMHGNIPSLNSGTNLYRGSVGGEFYSNTLACASTFYNTNHYVYTGKLADNRGGSALVYGNRVSGQYLNVILREEEVYLWGYWPAYSDPVTNTYCWDNTGGTLAGSVPWVWPYVDGAFTNNVSSTNVIRPGIEYFTNAPADFAQLVYPHPLVTAQDYVDRRTVGQLTVGTLRGSP